VPPKQQVARSGRARGATSGNVESGSCIALRELAVLAQGAKNDTALFAAGCLEGWLGLVAQATLGHLLRRSEIRVVSKVLLHPYI
jgi:hypothetical protein